MEGEKMREKDHGWASVIGQRREMEDAVTLAAGFAGAAPRVFDYFPVFDGHGGATVAEACRESMHVIMEAEVAAAVADVEECGGGAGVVWERVMAKCFEKMDDEVAGRVDVERRSGVALGSTAVVVVVGKEEIVVGNCGDSRAVRLSSDHKSDRPDEFARIEAAGGLVINYYGACVMGVLATSRSIGDDSLILATDGLWDVMSDQEACQLAKSCLYGRDSEAPETAASGTVIGFRNRVSSAATLLAQLAIAQGSNDNITIIAVELRKSEV